MGANTFTSTARGKTAEDAFQTARACDLMEYESERLRDDPEWRYDGYSGTIHEKDAFTMIALPTGKEPMEYAEELIEKHDRRIDDKWGPAGCFDLGDGKFFFFGWASS